MSGPRRAPRWARLTWQVADPAALAADLERWLGVRSIPHHVMPEARLFRLGDVLELVPWRAEQPGDVPRPGGRLVLEPIADGIPERTTAAELPSTLDPGTTPVPDTASDPAVARLELVAVGWATVDLDQAAIDLEPWLVPLDDPTVVVPEGQDPHLGARTRVWTTAGLPGTLLVLAEPSTEGRVSASLARHGEGPCAIYLRPSAGLEPWIRGARARGVDLSPQRAGPLGTSVLVTAAPTGSAAPRGLATVRGAATLTGIGTSAGPQIIVVDVRSPTSGPAASGTIGS